MRAGVSGGGVAHKIAEVVHSHDGRPCSMWNQEFCECAVDDFETVNGAVGELNVGLHARRRFVESHDLAGGVHATHLSLSSAGDINRFVGEGLGQGELAKGEQQKK